LAQRMAGADAAGYRANGEAVPGRWRVHPEVAAAGLWTTASDLARFALGIQQSLAGDSNTVLFGGLMTWPIVRTTLAEPQIACW